MTNLELQVSLSRGHSLRTMLSADNALYAAAALWLCVALLGQWAFFYYIVGFYGPSILSGSFDDWNRLMALGATPYVAGDTAGNLVFLAHALGAGIVALGGALQLVPWVRANAPVFHHWNGRVFLVTVVLLSLTGFYLVWIRGETPQTLKEMSTSINGALILSFAFITLRAALARQFAVHRRWALRLYLVSNAQWFLRVGVFSYFIVSQLAGRQAAFSDPFFYLWTFGCYLAPLAVLEIYLRVKDGSSAVAKGVMATGLVALTLLMAVGVFGFAMFSQMLVSGAPLQFP